MCAHTGGCRKLMWVTSSAVEGLVSMVSKDADFCTIIC
jgi:hypothetical protein